MSQNQDKKATISFTVSEELMQRLENAIISSGMKKGKFLNRLIANALADGAGGLSKTNLEDITGKLENIEKGIRLINNGNMEKLNSTINGTLRSLREEGAPTEKVLIELKKSLHNHLSESNSLCAIMETLKENIGKFTNTYIVTFDNIETLKRQNKTFSELNNELLKEKKALAEWYQTVEEAKIAVAKYKEASNGIDTKVAEIIMEKAKSNLYDFQAYFKNSCDFFIGKHTKEIFKSILLRFSITTVAIGVALCLFLVTGGLVWKFIIGEKYLAETISTRLSDENVAFDKKLKRINLEKTKCEAKLYSATEIINEFYKGKKK